MSEQKLFFPGGVTKRTVISRESGNVEVVPLFGVPYLPFHPLKWVAREGKGKILNPSRACEQIKNLAKIWGKSNFVCAAEFTQSGREKDGGEKIHLGFDKMLSSLKWWGKYKRDCLQFGRYPVCWRYRGIQIFRSFTDHDVEAESVGGHDVDGVDVFGLAEAKHDLNGIWTAALPTQPAGVCELKQKLYRSKYISRKTFSSITWNMM